MTDNQGTRRGRGGRGGRGANNTYELIAPRGTDEAAADEQGEQEQEQDQSALRLLAAEVSCLRADVQHFIGERRAGPAARAIVVRPAARESNPFFLIICIKFVQAGTLLRSQTASHC